MAITSKGLNKLGFTSGTDYILEADDSGIQITWLSGDTQPTVSAIEAAHTQWENDVATKVSNKINGRDKLVALGLTTDELDAMGL